MLIAIVAIIAVVMIACSLTVFIRLDALNSKAYEEDEDSENKQSKNP